MRSGMTLTEYLVRYSLKRESHEQEIAHLIALIAVGVKHIRSLILTAGTEQLGGESVEDRRSALDRRANEILVDLLSNSGHFGLLASEEREEVVATVVGHSSAKYVVAFDPIEGPSNLGSMLPVSTIFGIFCKKDTQRPAVVGDFLQPGNSLVAAGYAVYGAKTVLVLSSGQGVQDFVLNPLIGEFVLSNERLVFPEQGLWYCINEGHSDTWTPQLREFINQLRRPPAAGPRYTGRYSGSLGADFDRLLREGGIYLYPANPRWPQGRSRLIFECLPLAFIAEQAEGMATDGYRRMLDLVASDINERSPIIIGARKEMELFKSLVKGAAASTTESEADIIGVAGNQ